ncbi:hypothetical protein HII31_09511 [Pseudocercospora fuligena]|uniref:F-box domain-containing protein n=1 Tax=Pseudocercospora fuligena TaxID=685502 RepID=A0A8H6VIB6_9PEZI|nr:hypothetical protein HII31_09511 [Pseudocercospora fuligena]
MSQTPLPSPSSTKTATHASTTVTQPNTTPSKVPTRSLLDLPVEIKTNILSRLQPSEIQIFRATCKHARDLVDEPSNANELYQPSQARNLERLSGCISRLCNLHGLNLLDALSIWIAQRGILVDSDSRVAYLKPFLELWSAQRPISVSRKYRAMVTLVMLADTLMNTYIQAHLNEDGYEKFIPLLNEADYEAYVEGLLAKWDRFNVKKNLKRYYIDKPTIKSWFRAIASDPSSLAGPDYMDEPQHVLTDLRHLGPDSDTREVSNYILKGHPSAHLLGLPDIPKSLPHFGFCVRTVHAKRLLDLAYERGQKISEKDKAFILEQTYLY